MLVEPGPGHRIAVLGPLAQGEQGLVAAGGGTGPGDGQDLVGGQIGRRQPGRRLGEGAVAAAVATEMVRGMKTLGE